MGSRAVRGKKHSEQLRAVATRVGETGEIAISKADQDIKKLLEISLAPIPELASGAVDAAQQDTAALAEAQKNAIIKRYSYGAGLCALVEDKNLQKAGELAKKKIEEYKAGNMEALETLRDIDLYVASVILARHTEGGLPESAEAMRALASLRPEDVLEREKHLDAVLGAQLEIPIIQLEQRKKWLGQLGAQYEGGLVVEGNARMGELLAEASELKKQVLEEKDGEKRKMLFGQFSDALEYAQAVFTLTVSYNRQLERAEGLEKRIAELQEAAGKLEQDAEKPKNAKIREELLASAETTRNQVALLEAARALAPEAGREISAALQEREALEAGAGRARHIVSYSEFLEAQAGQPAYLSPALSALAKEIAEEPGKVILEKEKYDLARLLQATTLAAEMQILDARATIERVGESGALSATHKKEVEGWVSGAIGNSQEALVLLRKKGATKDDAEKAQELILLGRVKIESAKEIVSGLEEAGVAEFSKGLQEGEKSREARRWDSLGEVAEKPPGEQREFIESMVGRAIRIHTNSHALAEEEIRESGERAEEISLMRAQALGRAGAVVGGIGAYVRAQETLEHAKKGFRGNGLSPWEDRALSIKERKQGDEEAKIAHLDSVRSTIAQIENGLARISGGEKEKAPSWEETVSANGSILRAAERVENLRSLQEISAFENRIGGFAPKKKYTRTLWDAAQKAREAISGKGEWGNTGSVERRAAAQRFLRVADQYADQFLTSTWKNCRVRADGSTNPSIALPEIEREVKERGERKVLPSELARKHTGRALRAMVERDEAVDAKEELKKGQIFANQAKNGYTRIASIGLAAATTYQSLAGMGGGEEIGRGGAAGKAKPPEQVAAEQMEAAKVDAESRMYEKAVWAYGAGEIGSRELSAAKRKVETVLASAGKSRQGRNLIAAARQEEGQVAGEIRRLDSEDAKQEGIIASAESLLFGLYNGEVSPSKRAERKKNADQETKERMGALETQVQLAKATREQISLQAGKLQTRRMQLGTVLGQAEVAEKIEKRRELEKESARIWGRVAETEQEIYATEDKIRELESEITSLEFQDPGVPGHLAASAQSRKTRLRHEKRELERLKEKRLGQRQEIVENDGRIASLPDNFEFREIDDPENVQLALRNIRNEREGVEAEAPNLELAGKYGEIVVATMENDQKGITTGIIRGRDSLRDPRGRAEINTIEGYQRASHLAVFGGRRFLGDEAVLSRLREYRAPQGSAEERRGKAIPEGREANEGMQGVTSLYAARVSPTEYSNYAPVATALNESDRALFEKPPAMPSPGASEAEWIRYEGSLEAYQERKEKAGMVAGVVLAANHASASAGTWVAGRNALASQVASARGTMLGAMENWGTLSREQIASRTLEIENRAFAITRINDMAGYGELSTLVIELATPVGWALIVAKMAGGAMEQMAQTGELPLGTLGEIALMESGKLGMVVRFGRAAESIAWARRAVPRMATAGEKAKAFASVAGDIAFGGAQLGTVVHFTRAAASGAYHGMQEVQETGMGFSHVISQTVFTGLPLKGPVMGVYGRWRAERISKTYWRESAKRYQAQAAEAKARGAYLEMEKSAEAARAEMVLGSRSIGRAAETAARSRGIEFGERIVPVPRAQAATLRAEAERLGLERPTVVVDMQKALPPQPARARAAKAVEAERPPSLDSYFHGKRAEIVDGKVRYIYTLQEGVVPKSFSEMQVREMEQAVFYAEKIARGEVVEIPRSIRKMAEALSVEGEFVRAVEVLDAVSGSGGGRDARALAHYVKSSKEAQFRLVVEAFESERMSGSYRLEMEAAAKRSSALAEVESVLKEHSGEKKAIEIEYSGWRNELEAGDTVRVRIPAQKGMRLENVRIERIAPAEYGRQMIITYTVESTGSTGMVAVRPGARGVDAHNTIAANVLNHVRAFEVPAPPAAAPIPQAAQAREFGEFWVGVEQGRAVAGERFRVADAQGKMVEATLSRVHVTPKSTILQFTVEGKSFAATLGRGESAARAEAIVRSKVLAAPAPAVAAPAPALAAPVQQAAPPQVAQPRDFGEFWGRISRGKAKLGEKFTLADVQGKKIEATLDAINVTPAGTTTITITAGQRTFALTSKVGMNVVGQAEAEASIRNILKPAAPKQAAERAQSRKERQEAQFMDRHSTEWVEKTISETLPKIGETSAEQGRRLLAYRRAAMEAPEARKAILEKVLKRVPAEARESVRMEWRLYVDITIPGADGGKILFGLESFSSIPVNEKSPKITADINAFLAKAVEANAHGITQATGGHERITDILIRGELHQGAWTGPLKRAGMDRSTSSAFHGPFWVVLESGEGISGARFSDHHIAYVFPTRQHREISARAVKEAYSKGIITRAEAVDALTKMVSAKEAGKSPKGMFSNFAERNVEVQRAWNERALVAEGELASFERFGMGRSGARASEGKAPGSLERLENYSGENVAMPLGDRILVYDGAYLLGKHGTGTESAGSKLGNVETPGQLADIVRRHVNAETLARTEGITRLANIDAKKVTGTDSLVEITFIREGGKRVNAGTELKEGVNYDATVRDANGVEHRAIVRYEVVREGSPDGRIPPIRQAVAYTLAEPPPTTKLNIVIGRIDLADPRAGWVNEGALRRRLGDRAVDGAEGVYSIFTIFPGRYTPAADARNGASVDALVGMTGLEFWNGRPASAGRAGVNRHALMRKPTGEIAERLVRREADTSEAGGGRSGTQANAERASVPAYDNKALSREFKENGIDARAMGILQKTSLAELNAALGKAGFNAGEVAKIIDLAGRHRIAGAQAKAKTPAQQGQKAKKSEKPAEDAKQAQKSEDANARLLRAEEAVGKMPKAERDSLEAKLRPHIGALRPMFQRADFKGAEVEAYLLKNGFSKAEANSAINLLLSATNRVTDYSSMAQALEGYSTLFELGQSLSPLMGKVRKAGIVPGRGPGIHVGDLIDPRSPEYSLRAVESLNKPLPIRTKGKSSKKLISGQDVDVSIAGFRESAQRVYGPEILEMGSRIRNEKIFKEYFKLETVSKREMYLDRVTKSANWMEGISSRSLREYIRNRGREGLESVLQFSDAMRSAERLKARVERGDTTLKIEDAIRVVENIQTAIERGFSDFRLTAMATDGSTQYLIRITPSGLSHLVEGHFGDASNPQQAAALIRRAIGGQPTGRVESSSPVAGRVQETMTFGEFRALVGENTPIAFSRLKTMDGGYSILATRIDSSYAAPITLNPDGTTTVRLQFITAFETTGVYSNEFTRTVLHPGGE